MDVQEQIMGIISEEEILSIVASMDKIIKNGNKEMSNVEWNGHMQNLYKLIVILLPLCTNISPELKKVFISSEERLQEFLL